MLATAFLSLPFPARAAVETWNPGGAGGGSGTWDTVTGNWNPGQTTWTDGNDALFSGAGGIVNVVNPAANSLTFSAAGPYLLESGTLTLSGSDVTVNSDATVASALIATAAGLAETGAGVLTLTGSSNLGSSDLTVEGGTVNLTAGSLLSDSNAVIDHGGSVTVSGGSSAETWISAGYLLVGESGTGTLSLTNGADVANNGIAPGSGVLGDNAGSNGTVTVAGNGSTLTEYDQMIIGNSGIGTLQITSGGTVNVLNASYSNFAFIGNNRGSSGTVTVSGTGSNWTMYDSLEIGGSGAGMLRITAGGAANTAGSYIAANAGSIGNATVSGSGSTWNDNYQIIVGESGAGTLLITNGGSVNTGYGGGDGLDIGYNAGSSGMVTVSGSGSTLSVGNESDYLGEGGTGVLLITGGGAVTFYSTVAFGIGADIGSSGMVTVSGSGSTLMTYGGSIFVGGKGRSDGLYQSPGGSGLLRVTDGGLVDTGSNVFGGPGPQTVVFGSGTVALGKNATLDSPLVDEGGAVTLVDGKLETVVLTYPTAIQGGNLDFEVGAGSDQIALSGSGSLTVSGTPTVNLYGLSGLVTSGTDVLISAADFSLGGNLSLGNVYNGGNFTYSLLTTATSLDIVVSAPTPLTTAYWKGGQNNVWSVLLGGTATNWTTDSAGTIDPHLTPSATTDVIFSAGSSANEADTVLGASVTIHSLTVSDTNAVVISGSDPNPWMGTDTLTISGSAGTTGITVESGAGLVTIGANLYLSGSSQTVTASNAAGLLVSGSLGSSNGLIKLGTGALTLTGAGAFGGATVDVEHGTLAIESGGVVSNGIGYVGENAGSAAMAAVSGSGSTWTNTGHLFIGYSGNGALAISNGGAVSDAAAYLGVNAGSNGAATLSGSGSAWTSTNNLVAGYSGTGSVTISSGGAAYDDGGYAGYGAGASGTVTVSGSGSKWANTGDTFIADSGTGTLAINGGGVVSDFASYIGLNAGSRGVATLSGTGSKWTDTSNFVAGFVGAGTVTSSSGAALSDSNGYIGYEATGAVTLSGSGTDWTNISNLHVGDFARGTLTVSGGAVVSDFSGYLGASAGSDGLATISGTGSTWTNRNNFAVGYSGTGVLIVSGGGAVSDAGGYVGYGTGSIGTVTVSGSGAKWSTSGALAIGDSGTGTLIVEEGAWVSVTGATTIGSAGTLEFDGGSTFNTGSLGINGGALVTLGAATFAPSATLGAGGVRINSDGFNSIFSGNFSGTGGITKVGSGVATLTGASTYTGATSINAGTLALTTASAHTASVGNTAITVASGATFSATLGASPFSKVVNAGTTGSGSAGATLTLNPGSTFSMAGNTLATFNLQQENSFSGTAFTIGGASGIAPGLIFDIGNAAQGTDLLSVTRTVSVLHTGGDITIDALAGDTSLTAGNYDLITTAGGFSGANDNGLSLSGTTLAISGATYDLSLAHSTADDEILTVSASAPSAPESSFARFDASTPDLTRSTLAGHADAPLAVTAAVPEPGAVAGLVSAFWIVPVWALRRRRGAEAK